MNITVALGQIQSKYCDITANVERHLEWIEQAKAKGAHLIVFPELSLVGYYLREAVHETALSIEHPLLKKIIDASRGISVIAGFVEKGDKQRFYERQSFYNAALFCEDGKIIGIHRKMFLPTYGLFEEGRYFTPGQVLTPQRSSWGRVGLLICEDSWYPKIIMPFAQKKIDILIIISASPTRGITFKEGHLRKNVHRAIHRFYARNLGIPVVFANKVSYEHGLFFWGGSAVYSPDGALQVQASLYSEELLIAELTVGSKHRHHVRPISAGKETKNTENQFPKNKVQYS